MLLDRFGNEIPIEKVRRSIGFVSQELPIHDEEDSISGIRPSRRYVIDAGGSFTEDTVCRRRP